MASDRVSTIESEFLLARVLASELAFGLEIRPYYFHATSSSNHRDKLR
jgi:hypothetical protein